MGKQLSRGHHSPAKRRILIIIIGIIVILFAAGTRFLSVYDSYKTVTDLAAEYPDLSITEDDSSIWIVPEGTVCETAVIFYPGAQVDPAAYGALLCQVAEGGYLCVIEKMPLHMAFLNKDAAEDTIASLPGVNHWYIGGHSLGGAMACEYIDKAKTDFDGVILLAAYSAKQISDDTPKALSIYGTRDGVLNRSHYDKNKPNLPECEEILLRGANHSQFGTYGPQKDDGEASITAENQIGMTAGLITEFLEKNTE